MEGGPDGYGYEYGLSGEAEREEGSVNARKGLGRDAVAQVGEEHRRECGGVGGERLRDGGYAEIVEDAPEHGGECAPVGTAEHHPSESYGIESEEDAYGASPQRQPVPRRSGSRNNLHPELMQTQKDAVP